MSAPSEDDFSEKAEATQRRFSVAGSLWTRAIELWLSGVVVAFFVIRILGSQTAKRLLSGLHSHFQ